MSALVVAAVFTVSPLTRNDCSTKWISLELLESLAFPNAEPDSGLPIGTLLLSDVAGPWVAVGLFCIPK